MKLTSAGPSYPQWKLLRRMEETEHSKMDYSRMSERVLFGTKLIGSFERIIGFLDKDVIPRVKCLSLAI